MYREHAPSAALRHHVACYWTLDRTESPGHRVLPDGCMDLLFDLGGASPRGARRRVEANAMSDSFKSAARVVRYE